MRRKVVRRSILLVAKRTRPRKPFAPTFKAAVPKANYRFESVKKWTFKDKVDNVNNCLTPANATHTHLILRDSQGTPRFALGYVIKGPLILISGIQRERTQYTRIADTLDRPPITEREKGWFWDPIKEKEKSNEFKMQLGMHPAEFLMNEFILRQLKRLTNGKYKLYIQFPFGGPKFKNNTPLIARFFKRKPVKLQEFGLAHELDFEKQRVKALISAQATKHSPKE